MSEKYKMTTEIPEGITIPDQVETSIGVLEFFDGFPSKQTVKKAYDFLELQRGVSVFLEEMRAASSLALREGLRKRGVKKANQVAVFEVLMDSKALWLTANSETVYGSTFLDLETDGPTVIESPPRVLGILDDMWMRYVGDTGNAGPDRGQGGKYLVLPPGYEGDVPEGYHICKSRTFGVWFIIRGFLIDGDPGPAVDNFKQGLRIYPLAKADTPPEMEFINVSGIPNSTIHSNDFHFFEEMNTLIQEEHDEALSIEARGQLALLGIIKGEPFKPDQRMKNILNEAALIGAAIARSLSWASRDDKVYFYPDDDRTWFNPLSVGNHTFQVDNWVHHDARSMFHYNATGITPAMAIAMPGVGSQYAAASCDADGEWLDGSHTYKLTLPPNPPAKDFWSVVVYDSQTRSMLQTDQQFPSVNNQAGGALENTDGSTDVFFGPEPPEGQENNWAQTIPGKGFWIILRLYAPLEPWFDKTWRPGKIVKID